MISIPSIFFAPSRDTLKRELAEMKALLAEREESLIPLSMEEIEHFSYEPSHWKSKRRLDLQHLGVFTTLFHEAVFKAVERDFFNLFGVTTRVLLVQTKSYTYVFKTTKDQVFVTINHEPFCLIVGNAVLDTRKRQIAKWTLNSQYGGAELQIGDRVVAAYNDKADVDPAVPRVFAILQPDLIDYEKAILMVMTLRYIFELAK